MGFRHSWEVGNRGDLSEEGRGIGLETGGEEGGLQYPMRTASLKEDAKARRELSIRIEYRRTFTD